jgi:hypothetical protein
VYSSISHLTVEKLTKPRKKEKKEKEKERKKWRTKQINRERWWTIKQQTRQTLKEKKKKFRFR